MPRDAAPAVPTPIALQRRVSRRIGDPERTRRSLCEHAADMRRAGRARLRVRSRLDDRDSLDAAAAPQCRHGDACRAAPAITIQVSGAGIAGRLTGPGPRVTWLVNQSVMGRPSNTEERQAQITGALMKVMARRGYDGASIADIAKTARLTPGLVHYHFKSKQQILLAALRDLVARHDAGLEARLAEAGGDPIAELAAFIDFHLGLGADADPEALACWILLSGEALREPKVRAEFAGALEAMAARLAQVIRAGVAQRLFTCESAAAAASALVAAIQGYFVLAATARALIPPGTAALSTRRMAEGLLRPRRPLAGEARS